MTLTRDDAIRSWIAQEVLRTGIPKTDVAKALSVSPSAVTRILDGQRRVSISEMGELGALFDNVEGFREILRKVFPPGLVEPANDEASNIGDLNAHLGMLREVLKDAAAKEDWIHIFDTRPGDANFDIYVRDYSYTSISYPISLAVSGPVAGIECPSDILTPRFLKGDVVLLARHLNWKDRDLIFVRQRRSDAVDGETGMLVGYVTAVDAPKMSIAIENPKTGKVRPVKLGDWGDLGRIVLPNEVLGYRQPIANLEK